MIPRERPGWTDDWLIKCSTKGCPGYIRVSPGVERDYARELAAQAGWSSDAAHNKDWCPTCTAERRTDAQVSQEADRG